MILKIKFLTKGKKKKKRKKEDSQKESSPVPHPVGQSSEPTVSVCLPFKLSNYPSPQFGKTMRPLFFFFFFFFFHPLLLPLNHRSSVPYHVLLNKPMLPLELVVEANPDSFFF